MVRDNNAAPSSQQPAGVVASTQIIAQENIPPTARKKQKKTTTITSVKYQSVKKMIVDHIHKKELDNPEQDTLGVKQRDIVEWYMEEFANNEADATETKDITDELKLLKMIINKMINENTLIVIQEAPEPADEGDVPMLPDAGEGDVDAEETALALTEEQKKKPKRKKPDLMERILGLNPNYAHE